MRHISLHERDNDITYSFEMLSLSLTIFFLRLSITCAARDFFFVNLFYNNTFVTINSLFVNKERFTLVEYLFLISRFTNSEFNRWNFEGKYCDGSRIFMEYSENNM